MPSTVEKFSSVGSGLSTCSQLPTLLSQLVWTISVLPAGRTRTMTRISCLMGSFGFSAGFLASVSVSSVTATTESPVRARGRVPAVWTVGAHSFESGRSFCAAAGIVSVFCHYTNEQRQTQDSRGTNPDVCPKMIPKMVLKWGLHARFGSKYVSQFRRGPPALEKKERGGFVSATRSPHLGIFAATCSMWTRTVDCAFTQKYLPMAV